MLNVLGSLSLPESLDLERAYFQVISEVVVKEKESRIRRRSSRSVFQE